MIHFDYPTTLPNPLPYIRTAVKIEFGSLTDQRPTGTLRLHPPEFRIAELRRDYLAMRPMFLGEPISFDEMMSVLAEVEEALNR